MSGKGAILIVDDEAIILMALKQELLRQYGDEYLLETALDASEAGVVIDDLVRDGIRIILVISDWLMPGVKGDEFLAGVKRRHPEVRCIIISGQADPTAIARARELVHLDAFIRKPWNRVELLAAVDACIDAN
jgi:response regulator RpfG family c-di-GMP phosphodiesterase